MDMRSPRSTAAALALTCASAASSACLSLPFGSPAPRSADQLIVAAIRSLASAPTVRFQGSWVDAQGRSLQVAMSTDPRGDGVGTASVNGQAVDVLESGGRTFFRGASYWALASPPSAKLYGDSWVATQPGALGDTLSALTRPGAIGDLLGSRRYGLKRGGTDTMDGRPVVALADSRGTVYVTGDDPVRLVRLVGAEGYVQPDGSHDLRLDFDYPARIAVSPPASFIDPSDPHTLPARYAVITTTTGRCDAAGCEQVVTLRNGAGAPTAQVVLTVRLTSPAGAALGSCTAPVPPVAYNQTEDVRCTVTGQAWSTYVRTGAALKGLRGKATLQNPPYD
jgi:hypothetical protein